MGKVDRLHNRVERFAALLWVMGIVQCTPDRARRASITPLPYTNYKACPFMVLVGSILNQDALAPPPLFLSRYVIYLCFKGSRLNVHKFVRKTYRFLKINFFLLQKKYILFVGESTAGIDKIKMCQAIRDKIRVCHLRFCTQGREKGAQ